jgi:hypothetical protein
MCLIGAVFDLHPGAHAIALSLMQHYRVRQEMAATGREAHRSNQHRLQQILDKADQVQKKHIRLTDAALGIATVRSSTVEDQVYNVDLERLACSCPAADDAICAHLRAVARICGGEEK